MRNLITYFLRLGTLGFGGPVALIGYMHRDLVEKRKWISEEDYKDGLALSQLAPGPLAAQLSIYLGFVHYRLIGATMAGLAFVLPSFLMVIAIGYAYVLFDGLPWIQAFFYGVGASVIGIIAVGSYRLSRKSLGMDKLLWFIAIILAIITYMKEEEIIWIILLAGVVVWFAKAPPNMPRPEALGMFPVPLLQFVPHFQNSRLWEIGWFFTKAGAFVFGSGLAIVPFLYGGVVKEFGWLTKQQFLDAVAVAMITPGPVVITVGFIGFIVDGIPGASVAALATFVPCYLFTVIPAPHFKKYGKSPAIRAFVDGVTAAAIGAIAGAVLVLAKRTLTDGPTIILALGSAVILLAFKRTPEPAIIVAAALFGLILKLFL